MSVLAPAVSPASLPATWEMLNRDFLNKGIQGTGVRNSHLTGHTSRGLSLALNILWGEVRDQAPTTFPEGCHLGQATLAGV